MRGKRLLWILLVFALVSSLAMVNVGKATVPSLQVEPTNFGMVYPGDILYVFVEIYDVVGLSAIEFTLRWDPYVLDVIQPAVGTPPPMAGMIAEGPFMPDQAGPSGTVPTCYVSPLNERLLFGDSFLDPVTATGSGTVAIFVFEVIGSGSTEIELHEASLFDFWLNPMKFNKNDGKLTSHNVGRVEQTWPETSRYENATEGPDYVNTLYATVTNYGVGVGTIYARVEFYGFDPVTGEARRFWNDEGVQQVAEGATITLSTTGFCTAWDAPYYNNAGKWTFNARCWFSYTEGGEEYRQDETLAWAKPINFRVVYP